MTSRRAVTIYQSLLRGYPRRFRDEYGPDMVAISAHQLADERPMRVWARIVVDLATTIPAQHLEEHMNHERGTLVPLVFAILSVAVVLAAVILGSSGVGALMVLIAMGAGAIAVISWRRGRPIRQAAPVTAHWWKLLTMGAGVLIALIAITRATGELAEGMWLPTTLTGLFAMMAIATGLVLGIAHLAGSHLSGQPAN